jgi:hypothetical protein
MTCDAVRTQVLQLPDPRRVPDALRSHLAGCPGCALWAAEAGRLEGLLERLPVPPAPADLKAGLIDDLTAAGPVIRRVPAVYRPSGRPLVTRSALMYAGGLAAAVLVAVGGWLLIRPGPGPEYVEGPRHPLLDKVVQRNLALAKTTKADEKLDILGGLADDLAGEARALARVADVGELADLSAMFRTAVADGVVKQAGAVAATPVLGDRDRDALAAAERKLKVAGDELARVAEESPPHAQPVLRGLAETAREGEARVREATVRRGGM